MIRVPVLVPMLVLTLAMEAGGGTGQSCSGRLGALVVVLARALVPVRAYVPMRVPTLGAVRARGLTSMPEHIQPRVPARVQAITPEPILVRVLALVPALCLALILVLVVEAQGRGYTTP